MVLRNNNIGSSGVIKIMEHVEGDPPIQTLYLEYSNFSNAIFFALALKMNSESFHIHGCEGVSHLLYATI